MPAISGLGLAGEEWIHPLARMTACGSTGAIRPPPPAKVGGRPPREILWTTDKDRFFAAGRLGHLQLAIDRCCPRGLWLSLYAFDCAEGKHDIVWRRMPPLSSPWATARI